MKSASIVVLGPRCDAQTVDLVGITWCRLRRDHSGAHDDGVISWTTSPPGFWPSATKGWRRRLKMWGPGILGAIAVQVIQHFAGDTLVTEFSCAACYVLGVFASIFTAMLADHE